MSDDHNELVTNVIDFHGDFCVVWDYQINMEDECKPNA